MLLVIPLCPIKLRIPEREMDQQRIRAVITFDPITADYLSVRRVTGSCFFVIIKKWHPLDEGW